VQNELQEEIPPLKEKIKTELAPQQPGGGSAPQVNPRELEQGITLLQGWASAAGDKMSSAARHLDDRQAGPAAADQQAAIDELEKIWDAVIPFHALLARDLADQTKIAQSLAPASSADSKSANDQPSGENDPHRDQTKPGLKGPQAGTGHAALGTEREDLAPLTEIQERTLRRTQLLKLKAEAELARLEKSPPPDAQQKGHNLSSGKDDPRDAGAAKSKPVDPKQIKAGYQKAIELAPRAVEQMERAVKSLKQKDPQAAYPPADVARKILEEIQKAQPRNEEQDQKKQDQDKKNEDQKKQDQKEQQKNDQQKKEQQKDDREKKDQQKKDQQQKKPEEPNQSGDQKQDQKQPQPQVARDRIEDALRKVRERQQEKRERDRRMKARVFGRVPVEKDW
jgi:Ca-activated chloride channel family protein